MGKTKRQPESYYQGIVQRYISKKYGGVAVRELDFDRLKFDVVGFSPDSDEFYIVECKRTRRPVGVGQTFGQIHTYKAMVYKDGERLLHAFHKKLIEDRKTKIRFWAHAVRFVEAGKIPIRFYVALLNAACERLEVREVIKNNPEIGIIRINRHDECRNYIRGNGKKDYEICQAAKVEVPITMAGVLRAMDR